jgi:hypothetical protein
LKEKTKKIFSKRRYYKFGMRVSANQESVEFQSSEI